jgi:RecA-family ATPase
MLSADRLRDELDRGPHRRIFKPNGQDHGKAGAVPAFYTEADLAELHLPMPQFVIDGILPVGLALLSAPPKLGKTWLNFGAGRAVATGSLFGGSRKVRQGPVLFLDLEGNQRRAQKRSAIVRAGATPSAELHITHHWPPMQSGGLGMLEQAITEKNAALAMIDIWACFRPPRPKWADPYQHDHESAKLVQEMAHRTGCAVVLTHHNRKAEADDWTAQVSGTAGLTGACDTIIAIARRRGEADAVMRVTGRDLDEQELALSFKDGQWTILGDAAEYQIGRTRNTIHACLVRTGRAMAPKEIAEITGLNREAVKKALQRMRDDGSLKVDRDGRYYPAERGHER